MTATVLADANDGLIVFVQAARAAERLIFDEIPAERRDHRVGASWSAKDVLAHISAWRDRQASRLTTRAGGTRASSAVRMAIRLDDAAIDIVNAKSHAQRAAWAWERVEADADASAGRLIAALRATDASLLRDNGLLVGSILGSGPLHDLEHLSAVPGTRRKAPARALVQVGRRIAGAGVLLDGDAGQLLYNLACREALDGRLASARQLLRAAFRLRPDLAVWAATDTDLARLRAELKAMLAGSGPPNPGVRAHAHRSHAGPIVPM